MKLHFVPNQFYLYLIAAICFIISCDIDNKTALTNLTITKTEYSITKNMNAQNSPTVEEVNKFFNNQNILITYREGEVIYGTYYFLEIHYCLSGLYGRSVKQTVLGNEQRNSWQEFGNWKVIERDGTVGVYYNTINGVENFVPIYRLANGDLFINQGISITKQGNAICR
jgi:hypothetical protein